MSVSRRLLMFSVLMGIFLFGQPQLAFARVVSCESMALDPKDETNHRILESYYNLSAAIGGVSCWFYPHSNGKDGVVVPANWRASPTPFRRNVINQILYTITKAREKFSGLGALDNKLLFALHNERLVDADAEAVLGERGAGECWIRFGGLENRRIWMWTRENSLLEPLLRPKRTSVRFVAAHEIAHCLQYENLTVGGDPLNNWWVEGAAENYAAFVYPRLNSEHTFAREYDLNKKFTQDAHITYENGYSTNIFFAHYATKFGIENVLPLSRDLERYRANLQRYFRDNNLDHFFHDFSTTHYFREIVDTGGGYMPRVENVGAQYEVIFEADDTDAEEKPIPTIEHSKLVLLDIKVPKKHKLVIYPIDIEEHFFQSIEVDGTFDKEWNAPKEIAGDCENDRVVGRIFLSHTKDNDLTNVPLRYTLELDSNCTACTLDNAGLNSFKRLKKYGPEGKYGVNGRLGSPEWLAEHPQSAPSILVNRCVYHCVCRNKHMWKDAQVTHAECNEYYPNGSFVRSELGALATELGIPPPTICRTIKEEYERDNDITSSIKVLNLHCRVKCGKEHGDDTIKTILRPTDAIKEPFKEPLKAPRLE